MKKVQSTIVKLQKSLKGVKNENIKEVLEASVAWRSESDDSPSDSPIDVASAILKLMPLFLGNSCRSGGVNCSSSCCQFASSLDSRSIDGLLLSSSSRRLFMASLSGGLRLNCSVEEFYMGLIFLLDDISLRIFRTSSSRNLFATPI